jgi:hypothetical protein
MLRRNRNDSQVGQKNMSSCFRLYCAVLPAVTSVFAFACVDPDKDFDEFADRVVDAGPPTGGCPAEYFAVDGEFLLSIQTALGDPLRLVVTATSTPMASGGTVDLAFQPLVAGNCPGQEGNGGQPAGDPLPPLEDIPVAADGTFDVTQLDATTPGEANPITCADIVADIQFIGCTKSADLICGDIDGMVKQPLMLPLTGSTFGAIKIETGARGDANLPEPVAACPAAE